MSSYHIATGDQPEGPYTLQELRHVRFGPETLVWRDGMGDWQRADAVPELRELLAGEASGPAAALPPAQEPDTFEVKIPAEVQRARPVTVYPAALAPLSAAYPGSGGVQYAAGGYAPTGALPVGAAVTSLVLGILALMISFFAFCLWIFSGPLAILAVVFGHVALSGANRGTSGGGGMAIAGLICGYFALALTAFFMFGFLGLLAGA